MNDFIEYSELYHYGIKGMKWGVRRYQNTDGTLTSEGVYRYRAKRSAKTKKDVDKLYNTLSKQDKKFVDGDDEERKEWLSLQEGEFVVKRFLKKHKGETIAALDILSETTPKRAAIAIMVNPKARGNGYARDLALRSIKWFEENAERLNLKTLDWDAMTDNIGSQKTAESAGFKKNKKRSNDKWIGYEYKKRKH